MNLGRFLRVALLFIALVVLHYTLRPLLGWRASPDFLVVALLVVAVRFRPGAAAVAGFLIGLLSDALAPGHMGAAALAMSLIGFSAAWLKAMFFADNLALNGFFFFLGKWVFDLLHLAAEGGLGEPGFALELLLWSPLSAAVTAAMGVLMLILLRPLLEVRST